MQGCHDRITTSTRAHSAGIEFELLLLCARPNAENVPWGRINSLVQTGIDWNRLITSALEHGIAPAVYRVLVALDQGLVPLAARDELRRHVHWSSLQQAMLKSELLVILNALADRDIDAIVLKGLVLATSVYDDPTLRHSGDIDLLIRSEDLEASKAVLLAAGYKPQPAMAGGQERAYQRYHYAYPFLRQQSVAQYCVELHWTIGWPYSLGSLDVPALWESTIKLKLGSKVVTSFSFPNQMLYLCIHGAKHFWCKLAWLSDVAALAKRMELQDWTSAMERAVSSGNQRMLLLGVYLAKILLDASIPAHLIWRAEADRTVKSSADLISRWLCSPPGAFPAGFTEFVLQLRLRERLRDKLVYAFGAATAPRTPDLDFLALPPVLMPLYRVVRLLRLGLIEPLRPITPMAIRRFSQAVRGRLRSVAR